MRSKTLFVLVASSLVGCSSLLGLGDFKDAPNGSGGAASGGTAGQVDGGGGTATAGTGGTATGGSGGTAADAGDGGVLKCQPVGGVKTLFAPSDFSDALGPAQTVDLEHVVLANDPNQGGPVFVAVSYVRAKSNTPEVLFNGVRDTPGNPTTGTFRAELDSNGSGAFRMQRGVVNSSTVKLDGEYDNNANGLVMCEATFTRGGGDAISAFQGATDLSTPTVCTGSERSAFDPSSNRYALGCDVGSSQRALFVYNGAATAQAGSGSSSDDSLLPGLYTFEGGDHLIGTQNGYVRYGTDPANLKQGQLDLASSGADQTVLVALLPGPPATGGTLVFAARANQTISTGALYTGVFLPSQYADLGTAHPSELVQRAQLSLNDVPQFSRPGFNVGRITLGGSSGNGDAVFYWRFARDGTLLVENYRLPNLNSSNVVGGFAAPLGTDDLVVWAEGTGQQSDPSSTYVKAQVISCAP